MRASNKYFFCVDAVLDNNICTFNSPIINVMWKRKIAYSDSIS